MVAFSKLGSKVQEWLGSNSFCLASRYSPDNSKRHRCAWRALGARNTTYSE